MVLDGEKTRDNPAAYCWNCNKFIGHRGLCSEKCHNEHYDVNEVENES